MIVDSVMRTTWRVLAVVSVLGAGTHSARAQDSAAAPSGSVLRTSTTGAVDANLAEAIDRLVRARLDAVGAVRITGSTALDLADVQLALGCVGETDACLGAAASEIGVDALVLPSLIHTGDETVLSIGYFRAGASPALRRVVARVRGADPTTETLEAVDGLLRQLFPNARFPQRGGPGSRAARGTATGPGAGPGHATSRGASLSPWPIVVAAVGVASLGTATAFGLASQSAADEYAGASTTTSADVDAALARLDDARSSALVANVFFVVGALALTAGVAWGAVELATGGSASSERAAARVAPVLGPNMAGVVVAGAL